LCIDIGVTIYKNKKIAIVHDWLVTDAGAEKVLKAILEIYPDADVFSIVDFLSDVDRESVLGERCATTSFIQKLPFAKKHFRNYLPLFPKAVESFDLSSYDIIISSSWAFAKGIKKDKNQLHICYCHTPIRYAWDLYDEYTSNLAFLKKQLVKLALGYIRKWDVDTSCVDFFIANSEFVKTRIAKTYGRDAFVIYPPVDTCDFKLAMAKGDYYLTASRLVGYKKTRLIVEAFVQNGKRLLVVGDGEELDSIKHIATPNIEVLGYRSRGELITLMQNAKAFVYAALEDFGIVPVEAMSCGTPVIAYGVGGVAESVIDGVCGLHFMEQSVDAINQAVNRFESMEFDSKRISERADAFSKERFIGHFKEFTLKFCT